MHLRCGRIIKPVLLKNSNNLPWIDKAYVGLSRKRDALFSKAIKFERDCGCRSETIWQHYKSIRNACEFLAIPIRSGQQIYKKFRNNGELILDERREGSKRPTLDVYQVTQIKDWLDEDCTMTLTGRGMGFQTSYGELSLYKRR